MRLANARSTSGGIAWSFVTTRYQDGIDFHAGTPIAVPNADAANGCCVAYITFAFSDRGRRGRPASQRLILIDAERRDIHQSAHVRGVGTECGHDLTAVRMAGDDGRSMRCSFRETILSPVPELRLTRLGEN